MSSGSNSSDGTSNGDEFVVKWIDFTFKTFLPGIRLLFDSQQMLDKYEENEMYNNLEVQSAVCSNFKIDPKRCKLFRETPPPLYYLKAKTYRIIVYQSKHKGKPVLAVAGVHTKKETVKEKKKKKCFWNKCYESYECHPAS